MIMIESFYFTSDGRTAILPTGRGGVRELEFHRAETGLANPADGRDACGVGFVAERGGRPTRRVLPLALTALCRMSHRGAVAADGRTGDGAGVTTQIPHLLLAEDFAERGKSLPEPDRFAAGLLFLPRGEDHRRVCRQTVERVLGERQMPLLGWRKPPLRDDALGATARRSAPVLSQIFVGRPDGIGPEEFERGLFLARKEIDRRLRLFLPESFSFVSLSHRTLVYKALVRGVDLGEFFEDLSNPLFETAFALFHQRYSTNTVPSWARTQPFRLLAHNGEINTIAGNRARMEARAAAIRARGLSEEVALLPLLDSETSDSANLDNAAELLLRTGRPLLQAISMLMPPAWENDVELPGGDRAFFEYHAGLLEPWDGPALVVFTDGRVIGAAMDRNGLRPARTIETRDGLFLLASEAGVAEVEEDSIVRRGRLGPGDVVALDLSTGDLSDRERVRGELAAAEPYEEWVRKFRSATPFPAATAETSPAPDRARTWKAFGYTREQMRLVLGPMRREGREPLGSMGDDTPLAVLSGRGRSLFSYFKQRFAQVTNPPIDPLRESIAMSLDVLLGPEGNLFAGGPDCGPRTRLPNPVLRDGDLEALRRGQPSEQTRTLDTTFAAAGGVEGLRRALRQLPIEAERSIAEGAWLLVLSDRRVDGERAPIPALLSLAAVHQRLLRGGSRLRASVIVETGEGRDEHETAALLAFGADAVNPYLALEAIRAAAIESGDSPHAAQERYLSALSAGLLKILSKMGISTLRSYKWAPLFEAIGLAEEIVLEYFPGAGCPIGGAGLDEIATETVRRHASAFAVDSHPALDEGGDHGFRRGGEAHAFSPDVVRSLHALARSGSPVDSEAYSDRMRARDPLALRDLLEFARPPGGPIALREVEPLGAILRRFTTAAMSIGALSPEAHETLAIAMNRIGGRSNSGEGGADPNRFWSTLPNGDCANDRIKQVASARFGVTAEYLVSAGELQIKMAQGSKPGEGGQLPGHKVTPHIARLRHSPEGVTLISPPPHHDIYSIEDLAELIYTLKRVNPTARVGVKLVATAGIGTIATGVAKAFADSILVSGHDGGTGASPLGSIKNAGIPWEIGLAEAQQALVAAGLRERVRLQTDGGLKTGRDVVVAALLGAEEFAFGSAALVAAGCVMARQCHVNTCPVGIATQREDLRAKFRGTPEMVIHFVTAVAREAREILASLGLPSLAEAIGRTDLLEARVPTGRFKLETLDLSRLVPGPAPRKGPRRCLDDRNDPPRTGSDLDERALARLRAAGNGKPTAALDFAITNADRAVGARIAGELSSPLTAPGLPSAVDLRFRGSAGQSFGAFCVDRLRLTLEGEANDHLAKGMSGGEIRVFPRPARPDENPVLAGNAVLYGATGGRLFVAGRVGERFAVRNSGALAVVEGAGDHACEYMTEGRVALLGSCGRNLGAGMSGGAAYLLDAAGTAGSRVNRAMVTLGPVSPSDARELLCMIEAHRDATGSDRAREILAAWSAFLPLFRKVYPKAAAEHGPPAFRPRLPPPAARFSPSSEVSVPAV
jgi:glutamate synthase (ferredoxin)